MRHGQSNTRIYVIWQSMIQRCTNPNNTHYRDYGGRGIMVCREWKKFHAFYADMGVPPTPDAELDRQDNDGDYCKSNCKWSTRTQQLRNRRDTVYVHYRGVSVPLISLAESHGITYTRNEIGLTYGTVKARIMLHGWDIEKALNTPLKGEPCGKSPTT